MNCNLRLILLPALLVLLCTVSRAQRLPDNREWPGKDFYLNLEYPLIEPKSDTVSIFIVGDIISHRSVSKSAEEFGYSSFFQYVEDRLQGADLAIGNMEFPLGGKPYTGYPVFSGPDDFAAYLDDVGFDVLLTANNHMLDRGCAGMQRTIDALEGMGITYTGIAADTRKDTLLTPLMVHVRGLRIAIVNYTYGTNSGADAPWPKVNYLKKSEMAPRMAKAREADFVLVFPHWGVEYQHRHSREQEDLAAWFVSEGADAVIGSHPHVIQDMQWMDGVPVIYSLGNALSNQNDLPARVELYVTLKIVRHWGEAPRLLEPEYHYIWCSKPGTIEDSYAAVPVTLSPDHWRVREDYEKMANTYQWLLDQNFLPGNPDPLP